MQSNSETVRVIIRFRPQRAELLRGGGQGGSVVPTGKGGLGHIGKPVAGAAASAPSGFKIDFSPDGKNVSLTMPAAAGVRGKPQLFMFDQVLNSDSTQVDAFDAIAKATVNDVLKGFNGSIFAFGQTGSGKTFSMFGSNSGGEDGRGRFKLRGVIPRAADELFSNIAESEELEEVTIKCSFLEIYKEGIRDLLQPKTTGLKIRELPTGEVYVQGLSDEYVSSCADIMQLLAAGEKNRTTASTSMNEVSSRSHSVLIIVVNQKLKDGSVRVGKLNLADLAGSERIERTNATGETLEEAKKINQSLSALGNCINALTDTKRTHTPYRDSTLTFLLKDSLGGNCKSTILVCTSPEENDCLETLSALNFAKRAKKIKNSVSVNVQLGVAELTLIVNELRKELGVAHKTIVALQKVIKTMAAGGSVPKEMLDALLKPVVASSNATAASGSSSASSSSSSSSDGSEPMTAIEQVTSSADGQTGAVPAAMLAAALAPNLQPAVAPAHALEPLSPSPTHAASPTAAAAAAASSGGVSTPPSTAASPSPTPLAALPPLPQEDSAAAAAKLESANTEIDTLRSQLEAAQQAALKRELEWNEEKERMRAEFAASAAAAPAPADASSSSSSAALPLPIPIPVPLPSSSPRGSRASISEASEALVSTLRAKNERLERQLAEMKDTWLAYMDLVKEHFDEKATEVYKVKQEDDHKKSAKIVKPVKKGFFSTLFRSSSGKASTPASPAVANNSNNTKSVAFESPANTPRGGRQSIAPGAGAGAGGAGDDASSSSTADYSSPAPSSRSRRQTMVAEPPPSEGSASSRNAIASPAASSPAAAAASPSTSAAPSPAPTPAPLARGNSRRSLSGASIPPPLSASAAPNRGTLDNSIRAGYVSKRPVGFSIMRTWKKRFFVLRPTSIDYYDVDNLLALPEPAHAGSSSSHNGSAAASVEVSPARTPPLPETTTTGASSLHPAGSPLTAAASPFDSSSSSSAIAPSASFVAPPDLLDHFRGSVALDALTTVHTVAYSESPFGFEVTTRDKHTKLHVASDAERQAWVRDILAVVSCMKRGVDPAVLVPGSAEAMAAAAEDSKVIEPGRNDATHDKDIVNANFFLHCALQRLPEPSPSPAAAEDPIDGTDLESKLQPHAEPN